MSKQERATAQLRVYPSLRKDIKILSAKLGISISNTIEYLYEFYRGSKKKNHEKEKN